MTNEEKMKKAEKDLDRMIQEVQESSEALTNQEFKKKRDAYLDLTRRMFDVAGEVGGLKGTKWFEGLQKKWHKLARLIISRRETHEH